MTGLLLACLWAVAANVMALLPSRRHHWPQAVVLMVTAVPILVLVFREQGWVVGGLCLVAAASILRWPVYFLWRWLRRMAGLGP
jgi:thiamine transporter ThiT